MFQSAKGLEMMNAVIKKKLMLPPFTSISMQQALGKLVQLRGIYGVMQFKE
jgi:hypothetical protein